MPQNRTEETIANLDNIPALPTVVTRLIGVMDDPDSTVNEGCATYLWVEF